MDEENKKNTKADWLKKNHFNIIFALIFGIGGYLLWSNTRPKEPQAVLDLIKVIQENTKAITMLQQTTDNPNNVEVKKYKTNIPNRANSSVEYSVKNDNEISKTKDAPNFYTIRLDDFENALKAVALVSRQEAADDYHKSFSIFVAMLAIFGIGFPAFVAFLQHSFNEKQLEKIETTSEAVEESKKQANQALDQAKKTAKQANEAKKQAQVALQQAMSTETQANKIKAQAEEAFGKSQETAATIDDYYKKLTKMQMELYSEISGISVWLKCFYEGTPSEDIKNILSIFINGEIMRLSFLEYYIRYERGELKSLREDQKLETILNYFGPELEKIKDNTLFTAEDDIAKDNILYLKNLVVCYNLTISSLDDIYQVEFKSDKYESQEKKDETINKIQTIKQLLQSNIQRLNNRIPQK